MEVTKVEIVVAAAVARINLHIKSILQNYSVGYFLFSKKNIIGVDIYTKASEVFYITFQTTVNLHFVLILFMILNLLKIFKHKIIQLDTFINYKQRNNNKDV